MGAMMPIELEQFIGERAEQLAIVYLTRSPEIAIERLSSDFGLDMLITIRPNQSATGRVFGVQVKARNKAPQNFESLTLRAEPEAYQDFTFPILTIVFTMDNDQGYSPGLILPKTRDVNLSTQNTYRPYSAEIHDEWRSLNEYPIQQLISEVNAWYDTRRNLAA